MAMVRKTKTRRKKTANATVLCFKLSQARAYIGGSSARSAALGAIFRATSKKTLPYEYEFKNHPCSTCAPRGVHASQA